VDIANSIEEGRYISVDAADALSAFMINRMPDPARFMKLFGDLIVTVAEAAIRVERLTNRIAKTYDVDILCGYCPGTVQGGMDSHIFQGICMEISAVCSR
jgi:hypothetical protein